MMDPMKSRDPLRWSHQESIFKETESGQQFLRVLTFWLDAAEKIGHEDPNFPPYDAVQKAYTLTVEEFGPIVTESVADMLMLAINFWEHGMELAQGMTPIEVSFVSEAVFRATERLQDQAERAVN